jgi:hypothetical protein
MRRLRRLQRTSEKSPSSKAESRTGEGLSWAMTVETVMAC